MNITQIKELAEVVKTWNINLDSQSSVEAGSNLVPVLKLWVFKELFTAISTFTLGVIVVILITIIIIKIIKAIQQDERESREYKLKNKE